MPFNGSGGTSQPASSIYPASPSTLIESAKGNTSIADIYSMLASCIVKDGQTATTARIPFASGISSDTVTEKTADTGVTLDSVLLKDGRIDTTQGADIASAATLNLETATGNVVDVTGTTSVTAITLSQGHWRLVRFTGILKITNGASLVTGTGGDIFTNSGDYALFVGYAAGVVRIGFHIRGSAWSTGDVKVSLKTTADTGWVLMNDGTIGNALSGASTRANADTEALFTLLWTNTADAQCAVSTGRGASAAADFAANKTIALPKTLGRALAVYGAGFGLTSRALALATGTETHALSTAELALHSHAAGTLAGDSGGAHTHTVTGDGTTDVRDTPGTAGGFAAGASGGIVRATATANSNGAHTHTISGSTANTGSGTAHNNMQPTAFLNVMIKL